MGSTTLLTVAVVVVLALAWYLSFSASRLDRLHARVEGARDALDAQLVRRASVALELATSRRLDPASSVLVAEAAHEAREADPDSREVAESTLSRALRAALEQPGTIEHLAADPVGHDLLVDLHSAARRVELARRFLNDAVRATLAARRDRMVRWFRLAGHAARPDTFEMDDEVPAGLPR
ncbi:MAG TPA: hypothetical protein VLC50_01040 [Actinomycetes bacterium]|nr:hypothetical protein [Actinomycetes bacterium]